MSDKTNFELLGEEYEKDAPESIKTHVDGNRNLFSLLGGFIELMVPRIFDSIVGLFSQTEETPAPFEKDDTLNEN